MAGFSVSLSALLAAAVAVDEVAEDASAGLRRLDTLAADVLDSGWAGPAASAYAGAWHAWRDDAQCVLASLDEMATGLRRAAVAYADGERASTSGFERIAS
jgi:WXG100 family type VII secretion target